MFASYIAGVWSALLFVWFIWANKRDCRNQVLFAVIVLVLTAFVIGESSGEYYIRSMMK